MDKPDSTKVGFSTTVVASTHDLAKLDSLEPEVIELCGYSFESWELVKSAAASACTPVGLHCPIPHDGWVRHFDITGSGEGRREALELVERSLRAARSVNAVYVVVHFPSVIRASEPMGDVTDSDYFDAARVAAGKLQEMSREYRIPVFLENVSPNPLFHKAGHFKRILNEFPDLRLCFDPGHIHVSPGDETVYDFCESLSGFIDCVHIYGANPETYRVGFHDPPLLSHRPEEGWIDFPRLFCILSRRPPRYFIFEFSGDGSQDQPAASGVTHLRTLWRAACNCAS